MSGKFIEKENTQKRNKGNKGGGCAMTREMEYAKCIAVLCKLYRMGKVTESEFQYVKCRLKSRFMSAGDIGRA